MITCSAMTQKQKSTIVLVVGPKKTLATFRSFLWMFPSWLAASPHYRNWNGWITRFLLRRIIIHDNYHYRFPPHHWINMVNKEKEKKKNCHHQIMAENGKKGKKNKSEIIIPLAITAFKMLYYAVASCRCGASNSRSLAELCHQVICRGPHWLFNCIFLTFFVRLPLSAFCERNKFVIHWFAGDGGGGGDGCCFYYKIN